MRPAAILLTATSLLVTLSLGLVDANASTHHEDPATDKALPPVTAGLLTLDGQPPACLSTRFLQRFAEATELPVIEAFQAVTLTPRPPGEADEQSPAADITGQRFVVWLGSGDFTLNAPQRDRLAAHLGNGGFIVAGASCSDAEWAAAFRRELLYLNKARHPDTGERLGQWTAIDAEHPVFSILFDVPTLSKVRHPPRDAALDAFVIDGRVAMVFSPDGLNDSPSAPYADSEACCCCVDLREAAELMANLLAYALTR